MYCVCIRLDISAMHTWVETYTYALQGLQLVCMCERIRPERK